MIRFTAGGPVIRFTIDAQTGQVVPDKDAGAVRSFISWQRLTTALREYGEIKPEEVLTHFIVTDSGLTYAVERRASK